MTAWYVVYTQPGAEARALGHLARQGFGAYLPLTRRLRRHARRTEAVERPLFPRYLFVTLDLLQSRWRPILSTVGVCGMVRHGDLPMAVPDGVVDEIRARETGGEFDDRGFVSRLKAGDSVRIVSGAFSDLIGRFQEMADRERVIVLLDLLGRQVRARVSGGALAPA